jgi:hypothetical protein
MDEPDDLVDTCEPTALREVGHDLARECPFL